jgi:hypothetical protein
MKYLKKSESTSGNRMSFPRRRESRNNDNVIRHRKYWIPASAGMTNKEEVMTINCLREY